MCLVISRCYLETELDGYTFSSHSMEVKRTQDVYKNLACCANVLALTFQNNLDFPHILFIFFLWWRGKDLLNYKSYNWQNGWADSGGCGSGDCNTIHTFSLIVEDSIRK